MAEILKMGIKRKHNGDRADVVSEYHKFQENFSLEKKPFGITDLTDNCLQHILRGLDLNDLSNVANVNKHFNSLVYQLVGNKCVDRLVLVFSSGNAHWLCLAGVAGKFMFNDHLELAKFFEAFGSMISQVSINYTPYIRHKQRILNLTTNGIELAIFENCCKSLTRIEMSSNFFPVMNQVSKPFPNVLELEFDKCKLSVRLCGQLNSLFPSLHRLVLNDCKTIDPKCIEAHFPLLEELIVYGKRQNRMVFKKQNIAEAIRLNPQLRCLVIDFDSTNERHADSNHVDFKLDFDFYRFASESLPKLKYLKMYGQREHTSDPCEFTVEFGNLRKFSLQYIYDRQPTNVSPFNFIRLHELELEHLKMLSDDWVTFIVKNKGLKKLTAYIDCDIEVRITDCDIEVPKKIEHVKLLKIVKKLPKLREIKLQAEAVDAKDVVAILSKNESLQTVYLRHYDLTDSIVQEFDQLTAKKKWTVDHNCQNIILTRID